MKMPYISWSCSQETLMRMTNRVKINLVSKGLPFQYISPSILLVELQKFDDERLEAVQCEVVKVHQ